MKKELTFRSGVAKAGQGTAIKPKEFAVKKGEGKVKNASLGVIERVTFEGTNIRYDVRLKNQDPIVVVKPSTTEERVNMGEKITVSSPPEKAYALMYPEAGLKGEMSVE